ncbi:MAG: peptidoglycan-binding protein [Clostridia bacterium]|nr:peptidoglycan-binding protein [Clostridia bacterium]
MPTRIETPFTNEHFAAFCQKMVGQPYWYGTTGNRATDSLLKRKTAQYPSHYPSSRIARYKKDIANGAIVCDCIGGCKAYAWTGGGEELLRALHSDESFSSKYGANGCPDKSANGMFSYAKSKGMPYGGMSTLPDLPGIALWKDGHVGYTIGNGKCVEWRSFSYGCVTTVISQRSFQSWYYLPFIDYGENQTVVRDLKRGMTGKDVTEMQKQLISAGYALPKYGADGDFGKETEDALKNFQADNGLKSDGVFGEATREALDALTKSEEEKEKPPVQETEDQKKIIIRSNGGNVNLRLGNGTEYEKVASAKNGETFSYIATAENGWNAVKGEKAVLWVSGEYSILEE